MRAGRRARAHRAHLRLLGWPVNRLLSLWLLALTGGCLVVGAVVLLRSLLGVLLPLSRDMIRRRLETDTFTLNAVTPQGPLTIQFSPEWPGVRLGLFPHLLRQMKAQGLEADPGDFCVVLRETGDVVGQIGAKAPPDAAGAQL